MCFCRSWEVGRVRVEMQGYWAIYTLFRHVVLKEHVDGRINMPIDIIAKENVDFYTIS